MSIVERVASEGAHARRLILVSGGAAGAAGATLLLTAGAVILGGGRWLSLPAWLPFVWWALAIGVVAFAAWRMPRRIAATITDEALARATEGERGLRAGALVGLVQLASTGGALVRLQASYLGALVGPGTLAPRHAKRLSLGAAGAMAATLVVGVATWASAGSRADGWRALVHPIAAARGSLLDSLSLTETPASIVRGDTLTAVVHASGRRWVTLAWRVTGTGWKDTTLTVRDGRASLALGSIDAPVTLVASDGRAQSDSLAVSVFERPFAGDVAVRAVYPLYLGRASEVLTPDDVLRLPEGTAVDVMARAAGLDRLVLASEHDTVPVTLAAGRARARIMAQTSGTWRWLSPTPGADLPASLAFDVIPDSAPRIEIISPTRDTLVSAGDDVRLLVAATDDHGLHNVWLRMWNERGNGVKDGEHATQLADVSGGRWIGELQLNLTPSKLQPGDAMIVVAEARDGAPWGRVGESRRLELRVPTADARRNAAMSAADSAVARAAAAAASQKSLEKRTADAARSSGAKSDESKGGSGKDGAASFESQERARELVADQKALGDKLQELSKEADRLSKELQKAGVMDSSISAELKEAQRLLREAMTPEMQKQLRDLEAQRQKMTGDEMQDALNKLQDPQQNMREALEKAKEMLARAALEGRMQSVADEAKDLAQKEKQFADSGKAGQRPSEAKELSERAKALQEEAQKLAERLNKEQATAAKEGVKQAAQQASESAKQLQDAAQKATEAMGQQAGQAAGNQQSGQQSQAGQQGKPGQQGQQGQGQQSQGQQDAQNAAKQAAESMQKAAESMGQAREAQVNAWKQEITEALDRSIQETQQMARQQEQIGKQAQNGASSQLRAQQGAVQQGVQQTADRLAQQGQKSALISPNSQRAMDAAKQAVDQATRDLNDGQTGQQGQRSMQDAADALRQASASMSRDRERAGNSQTASGLPEMMQQMREMAGQQAQLNGAAAQLMPNLQQVGDGTAQKEAVKPLAEKQRELAQKLEDAADADPTKRAEALAREARQIAQQLERGELDRSVVDRQSQLFRRMLDAGRTLEQNERDESDKREAKSGQGINADAPRTGIMRGDAAVRYKEPTWKELSGATAEDRQLIIEYFRRLNAKKQ